MTTSVKFFLSRDFSARTDPPLDMFSTGYSHVGSYVL